MNGAREEVLSRIRGALADVPAGEAQPAVARGYRQRADRPRSELIDLFAERVGDYHADVWVVGPGDVGEAVATACAERKLAGLVTPPQFPLQWRPAAPPVVEDDGLSVAELDRGDGALTGCAAAIAETGTLILDGQALSGRRVLTLVPDHHICIVRSDQIVQLVPEAVAALTPAVVQNRLPITLVSGPSASSDIELSRVEGVHGPRHLVVVIVKTEEQD
jgi:L-lactate dehydrogenase complex protein LldG